MRRLILAALFRAGEIEVTYQGSKFHNYQDPASRTSFTFDCNPTGSDQKYAANQQACRTYAREHGIDGVTYDALQTARREAQEKAE